MFEKYSHSIIFSLASVYVPFNITRFNRRETLTLKFTVADRFKNPNLGFVSWNLRVTQLECPNGSPRIESNRSLMKPLIDTLRAPTNDGWLIGKSERE